MCWPTYLHANTLDGCVCHASDTLLAECVNHKRETPGANDCLRCAWWACTSTTWGNGMQGLCALLSKYCW
jgi:hypothetical protein